VASQGSLDFANDHRSGAEWAQLLGTSQANVSRWRAGLLRPSPAVRQRIHAAGGPPADAWDVSVGQQPPPRRQAKQAAARPLPKPKKKQRRKPGGATAAAVIAEADLWLAELEDFRAEIPSIARDARARAAMLANAAKTLHVLGKLTGVGLSISPRQILDSPNWRLIEAAIIQALKPFGAEPLRAVAKALDQTRGG
jgi:hypothetical protein